jgi:hypothetical protein
MAMTDPVEAARVAQQLLGEKIERVKRLAEAAAAEQPLRDLLHAAKRAKSAPPPEEAFKHVTEAIHAAEAALAAAQQHTERLRKEATTAGWSTTELAKMGLAKQRATRRRTTTTGTNSGQQDTPHPDANDIKSTVAAAADTPSGTGSAAAQNTPRGRT